MKTIITTCNRCECAISPNDEEKIQVSFEHSFGYGSPYDGQRWKIDLCLKCNNDYKDYDETSLEDLVKTFKLVPSGFMINDYLELDDDKHQRVFESYKETGEWEDLKYHTYEELEGLHGWIVADYLNDYVIKYHQDKPLFVDQD